MVTRKEVALKAGVSVATVSNVFNQKVFVLPETVAKVKQAAEELRYVPNFTARSLSLGHSYQIGIAVSECSNPHHMEIFKAISKYAADQGFMVTLFSMDERFERMLDFFRQRQFDAFINFSNRIYPEELIDLLEHKNTVLVNFCEDNGLNFSLDTYEATVVAMARLRDFGHKNVGYISTMDHFRWREDPRGKAFLENRAKMGFCCNDEYIELNDDNNMPSEEAGYLLTKKLMNAHNEITALFATNDLSALGAIRALNEAGLRVPEDVSVVGCDGISIGEFYTPRLSTIWFDKDEYGRMIAEETIRYINDNEHGGKKNFRMVCTYLERASTAPART